MSGRKGWFSGHRQQFTRLGSFNSSRPANTGSFSLETLEPRAMLAVYAPGFEESVLASGLSAPTDMVFAPDGRLFVAEKSGRVRVIENGELLSQPFLEVPADPQGHHGLLSLAFDPNFENNGYLYIFYTVAEGDPAVRLSRFKVSNTDPNVADPNSELPMIEDIVMPIDIHDGGGMKFGTDGMLYVGIGDGGIPESAQDMTSLQGKLLRLDVSNYPNIVPADNPFVGVPGVRPEIYASGLRNPFKLDVDLVNDRIWLTNTGDDQFEEVNEVRPGANYGWPNYEGPTDVPGLTTPIYSYAHDQIGGSITAGTFYYGNALPDEYNGDYFFADFSHQSLRRIDLTESNDHYHDGLHHELSATDFATGLAGPVDIEVGPNGEFYYLDVWTGTVYQVHYIGDGNRTPSAVGTADVSFGDSPLTVNFDGSLSSDPDNDDLFYSWDFGDGYPPQAGLTVTHTYQNPGIYQARLTVNDGNGGVSVSAPITIAVDEHPPTGQINVVPQHTLYRGGDTISFSGTGFDVEDGTLDASAFSWNITFHHHTHTHPVSGLQNVTGGSFQVPVIGETSSDVWYRISLTVTDSAGLEHTSYADVFPHITQVTLSTTPGLANILLDGATVGSPFAFDGVAGVMRSVEAPLLQQKDGMTYLFKSWSDGGAISHTIVTPVTPTTLTANYEVVAPERVEATYFVAGLYEKLLGRVADLPGLASNVDRLLAGDSPLDVIQSLWESSEHRKLQVIEAYNEFLDRIPATDEINYWVGQLNSGVSETAFARSILSSSEFVSLDNNVPTIYVSKLYKLVLKREGSPEEVQNWVNLLNNGVAHQDIANVFLTTGERYNVMLARYYDAYLDRPLQPSEALGDVYAGSATTLKNIGTSVLASSEFLTRQTARPTVIALYDNVLHRTPGDAEIDYWTNQLLNGMSRQVVVTAFHQSGEGLGHLVTEAYGSILERLPVDLERDYWVAQIASGATEQAVSQTFYLSAEYQALYPTDSAFISSLYSKILNREADAGGLQAWVAALQSGVTRQTAVATFFSTLEHRAQVIADIYTEFLGRSPVAAETGYWAATLPNDGNMAAALRTAVLSSDEYFRTAEVHTVVAHDLSNETYVAALYNDVLQRPATPNEIAGYVSLLSSGVSRFNVTSQIWNSPERATLVANDLYADLLGRAPTAQELANVAALLSTSGGKLDAAFGILTSNEYNSLYVANGDFVNALYSDVLQRAAVPAETQFWVTTLEGGTPRSAVAAVFQHSDEALSNLIDAAYNTYLEHDPATDVADVWLQQLSSGSQSERDLALALLTSEEYYQQQSP